MPEHPLYGPYTPGWKTLAAPFDNYEINEYGKVRNKKTQHIMIENRRSVRLSSSQGKAYQKSVYRLVLLTFFPEIPSNETVDHIDENSENHFVENLQWLTRSANTTKSNQLRPRQGTGARAKPIEQWTFVRDRLIQTYKSSKEVHRINPHMCPSLISRCANGEKPSAYGFWWRFATMESQDDMPDEKWTTNDKVKDLLKRFKISDDAIDKYRVSNKGRVINAFGLKTTGSICTRRPIYRVCRSVLMHVLVWAAWGERAPRDGEVICHDDTIPKDKDGCCSNAIEHLRLGTQKNNMQECASIGSLSKYNHEIEKWDKNGTTFIARYSSVSEACRQNGFSDNASIAKCARGSRKTAYKFTWRYSQNQIAKRTTENPCKRRRIN